METLDAVALERLDRLLLAVLREHFQASCRAQLGAAALHDIRDAAHLHRHHGILNEARIAALDAVYLHAEIDGRAHNGADGRVHAGRVAAARQKSDPLHLLILRKVAFTVILLPQVL